MRRTIIAGVVLIAIALSGCQSSGTPPTGAFEAPAHTTVVSTPPDIRDAQRLLNALGYGAGAADGVIGPRMRSAIADYQSRNGLEQTGQLTSPCSASCAARRRCCRRRGRPRRRRRADRLNRGSPRSRPRRPSRRRSRSRRLTWYSTTATRRVVYWDEFPGCRTPIDDRGKQLE
ncbi:peptidoglycan-binding domain-containing protein [Defluviicoccus vanus]|uniref:Peptidoglycan-binding protein n=1 Tax=Defluviicoccus vanus TaxID=111831 RepID=A0A7H1N373_9PROT|nr:peptidoglycan-binding protein [Defluviicoccus vanus]